jgi:D-alanine-D-alanine ligase
VGYRAKWEPDSFAYNHTVPTFDFPPEDDALIAELGHLARKSWHCFGLSGYARVDFRVDEQARPWILEINVNPCLSPDAGFAAALRRAGISYAEATSRIIETALSRGRMAATKETTRHETR